MKEHTAFTSGDYITWSIPSDQALTLYLSLKAEEPHKITGVVDASEVTFSFDSTGWASGTYTATLQQDSPRKTLDSWRVQVLPDPATAYDRRAYCERLLEAVEACLLGVASSALVEMEMGDGVKIKNLTHTELRKLQVGLRAEVLQYRCGTSALIKSVSIL